MNDHYAKLINNAIDRASTSLHWNPVYANVVEYGTGTKLGHIVSDGYRHESWTFYPIPELRKATRREYVKQREQKGVKGLHRVLRFRTLDNVIPKWVKTYHIPASSIKTYSEINDEASRKAESNATDSLGDYNRE